MRRNIAIVQRKARGQVFVLGDAYFYRLRATNGALDSGPSAVVSATTLAPPPSPTPPANLAASASSSSQIDLTWVNTSPKQTLMPLLDWSPILVALPISTNFLPPWLARNSLTP